MDFGLGDSLKLFEKHFGPKWSKALLGLIGFALVAFCINAIFIYLLLPTYHAIQYFRAEKDLISLLKDRATSIVYTSTLGLLLYFLLIKIAHKILLRQLNKRAKKIVRQSQELAERHLIDSKRYTDKMQEACDNLVNECQRRSKELIDECRQLLSEVKKEPKEKLAPILDKEVELHKQVTEVEEALQLIKKPTRK